MVVITLERCVAGSLNGTHFTGQKIGALPLALLNRYPGLPGRPRRFPGALGTGDSLATASLTPRFYVVNNRAELLVNPGKEKNHGTAI